MSFHDPNYRNRVYDNPFRIQAGGGINLVPAADIRTQISFTTPDTSKRLLLSHPYNSQLPVYSLPILHVTIGRAFSSSNPLYQHPLTHNIRISFGTFMYIFIPSQHSEIQFNAPTLYYPFPSDVYLPPPPPHQTYRA